MATTRLTGLQVSVFNLSSNYIDDLEDCTISFEVQNEEAKALKDQYDYPWATGRSYTIEATVFVSTAAALCTLAATGSAIVSISYSTGGNAYSGSGLITSASHSASKGALQRQKISIKGQGAPTIV